MAPGFFPLDEELALLPGTLSPWLAEALVRLSTHIPSFARASRELAWFTGVTVHPDTARRRTEATGALLVAHETAAADRIVQEHPAPPCTPDTLVFSVDGAMVPLRHGQWTEVRTLAVGEVQPPQAAPDGPVIHTTNLSSFSRHTDSTRFSTLATRELHRRGMEGARRVGVVVVDGAAWCQSFIDLHSPEAVRILDFAHAAAYVQTIGVGTGQDAATVAQVRHTLKHQGAAAVLPTLRQWVATQPTTDDLATALAYGYDETFCKLRSPWKIAPSQSRNRCPLSLRACLPMIDCADRANTQRTRMPDVVRAELYVTPKPRHT